MPDNRHSLLESSNVTLPTLDEIKEISNTQEADKILHRIHQLEQLHVDDPDMLVKLRGLRQAMLHRHLHNHLNQALRTRDATQQQPQ
jgi:hypothetical protein